MTPQFYMFSWDANGNGIAYASDLGFPVGGPGYWEPTLLVQMLSGSIRVFNRTTFDPNADSAKYETYDGYGTPRTITIING